jgi:hypothetical protein
MSAVLAVPLQKLPFLMTPMPCKLCKCKMDYMGPSVDKLKTYHVYICPACDELICASVNTVGGGAVEWVNLNQ